MHSRLRSLHIVEDGTREPTFVALVAKERAVRASVDHLSLEVLRASPLLSANAKTGVSFDFPVGHTCTPTAICARVCYAKSPRAAATWRKSLRKRLRNLRYVKLAKPEEVAERLARELAVVGSTAASSTSCVSAAPASFSPSW